MIIRSSIVSKISTKRLKISHTIQSISSASDVVPPSRSRCEWVGSNPHMQKYHDEEWGVAVHDDRMHFEMLILEGAQAGLSWDTILKKREGYRKAFKFFDPLLVSAMTDSELLELRENKDIVRNKLKIEATRTNSKVFLAIQKEHGSFDNYIWKFFGGTSMHSKRVNLSDIPVKTAESDAISADLKKRGMKFVGSTIIYAYMQAVGLVDDHTEACWKCRRTDTL